MGVYIIKGCVTGAYKIGRTVDIARRFKHHQTSCAERLALLLWAPDWDGSRENALNRQLRPYRTGGGTEWYQPTQQVGQVLADVMATLTPAQSLTSYRACVELNGDEEEDDADEDDLVLVEYDSPAPAPTLNWR